MSTVKSRLANLEFSSKKKKGPVNFVEEIRLMLQRIDGTAELGMLPDEDIHDVMVRRIQGVDGFDLSMMPGDSLKAKYANVEAAYYGKIAVSPEARHAGREHFALYDLV